MAQLTGGPPRAAEDPRAGSPAPPGGVARAATDEQHGIGRSIALHLLPGAAMLAFALLVAPVVRAWGLPAVFAATLGILLVLVPLQLGTLLYLGRRRTGRLSLAGIVRYRESMPLWQYLVAVPALIIWSFAALQAWGAIQPLLTALVPLPSWLADPLPFADAGAYSRTVLVVTALLRVVCSGVVAPVVEELYFRGYLLPRLDRFGAWAPVLNSVLFACYHLWALPFAPGRALAFLPLAYLVWRWRNLRLGIAVHLALNLFGVVGPLLGVLGTGS